MFDSHESRGMATLGPLRERLRCDQRLYSDDLGVPSVSPGQVKGLLSEHATTDVSLLDDHELLEHAADFERCRTLMTIASAHLSVEIDSRRASVSEHGLTTPQFLAQDPQQPRTECKRRVRVAQHLSRWFPLVDEAISKGDLSWAHADTLSSLSNPRIRPLLAELQPEIIEMARTTVFEHWRNQLRALCQLLDQDGGHDPANDLASNRLKISPDAYGITINGEFTADNAVVVNSAIDRVADELFRSFAKDREAGCDEPIPGRATLRALALVEVCRRSAAVDIATSRPPANLTSLTVGADTDEPLTSAADGETIPSHLVDSLRCYERIRPIVVNSKGDPLFVGRAKRLVTAAQRKALEVRDGGCVFPGCEAPPSWCVIHHVKAWHKGGATDLDNLAMICHHHHGLAHSTGWKMTVESGEQTFTWETPKGAILTSQRHGSQRHGSQRRWRGGRGNSP